MVVLMKLFLRTKLVVVSCEIAGGATLMACLVQDQKGLELHIREVFIMVRFRVFIYSHVRI